MLSNPLPWQILLIYQGTLSHEAKTGSPGLGAVGPKPPRGRGREKEIRNITERPVNSGCWETLADSILSRERYRG